MSTDLWQFTPYLLTTCQIYFASLQNVRSGIIRLLAHWNSSLEMVLKPGDVLHCSTTRTCHLSDHRVEAHETIFGWTLEGVYVDPTIRPQPSPNACILLMPKAAPPLDDLQLLWHMEQFLGIPLQTCQKTTNGQWNISRKPTLETPTDASECNSHRRRWLCRWIILDR